MRPTPRNHPAPFEPTLGLRRASALLARTDVRPSWPPLDQRLPGGGLEAGTILELLADEGHGGFAVALRAAAGLQAHAPRRAALIIDTRGELYPPALAQVGLDLARVVVLRPAPHDALACLDEALRSPAVVAVVARVSHLTGAASHRLRQAAHVGGGVGLLVRPRAEASAVSGAAVRLVVQPGPGGGDLVLFPLRVRASESVEPWSVAAPLRPTAWSSTMPPAATDGPRPERRAS